LFNANQVISRVADSLIANNMPIFHMGNNDINKVKSFVDLEVKLTLCVELAAD
jgi:ribonuclease D